MNWKSEIVFQLKEQKQQRNVYDDIIQHYNRLLENNTLLQIQCVKLDKDVHHLRLSNAGLERASVVNHELSNVNTKLNVATDEVIMHLREKGELAQEILRLNRTLTETQEKLAAAELKAQKYTAENDQLLVKLDRCESEIRDLVQINQVIRDEFQAVQNQMDQLQNDYTRLKPTCLELEQQLDTAKRLHQQREAELMECKKVQQEMLNAEIDRFNKVAQQQRKGSDSSLSMGNDSVSGSTGKRASDASSINTAQHPFDDSVGREKKAASPGFNMGLGSNLFTNFKKIFVPGVNVVPNDRLNRTLTYCASASVPSRELHRWDCTELEVYALQFQPSGSILATGCSDKLIHLWEITSTGQPYRYGSLYGSHGAINALDFDNEGARLLAGCSGDKAYIWSYGDHRVLKDTHTGHNGLIYACRFLSGTKLVTGSADRLIKTWDLHSRQCVRTLFAGSKCLDLVITDAAGTIVSGHFDKKIRTWDNLADQCRHEFTCNASVTSLSYNMEKQLLLACLKDDTVQLIDLRQNKTIYSFSDDNFQVSTDTHKAILSPDGQYACVGSQDGSLIFWNTTSGICESVLKKKHKTMVTSVAWHPEGRYVASCEKHREVILWTD